MASYYYANGHRVPLHRDPTRIAVNTSFKPKADVEEWKAALAHGRMLPGGVCLVNSSELTTALLHNLDLAGAVHPVFADDSATLVVLPEVRVEVSPAGKKSVQGLLDRSATPGAITEERDEMLVIRPSSGRGEDALRLANELEESSPAPRMAQARFVRLISRPEPTKNASSLTRPKKRV